MTATPAPRPSFQFVDALRFLCVALIVFGHANPNTLNLNDQGLTLSAVLYSLSKFDIVFMYVLSGFLMASLTRLNAAYIKRRAPTVLLPWLFWVGLLAAFRIVTEPGLTADPVNLIRSIVFFGANWFVINYFGGLLVLALLKKLVPKNILGPLLLGFTLLYSLNIYGQWFRTEHTTSWFGFIFFLWLGVSIREQYPPVAKLMAVIKTHWPVMFAAALTGLAAELAALNALGSHDLHNALKLSNIFYALVLFPALTNLSFKFDRLGVDPRKDSFGVYLVHYPIFWGLQLILRHVPAYQALTHPALPQAAQILIWLVSGALILTLSVLTVKVIRALRLGVLIGNSSEAAPTAQQAF